MPKRSLPFGIVCCVDLIGDCGRKIFISTVPDIYVHQISCGAPQGTALRESDVSETISAFSKSSRLHLKFHFSFFQFPHSLIFFRTATVTLTGCGGIFCFHVFATNHFQSLQMTQWDSGLTLLPEGLRRNLGSVTANRGHCRAESFTSPLLSGYPAPSILHFRNNIYSKGSILNTS